MGHKVNPLVFRLGLSNNWFYSFKEPKNWMTNYLVYQLVYTNFLKYTIPHFNREIRRNKRNDQGLVIMAGEKQSRPSPLVGNSYLFSHLNVGGRNGELFMSCYFYDYGVHHKRYRFKTKELNNLYNQFFANTPVKDQRRRWKKVPYVWKRRYYRVRKFPWFFQRKLRRIGPQSWMLNSRQFNWESIRKGGLFNTKLNLSWLRLTKKTKSFNRAQLYFFMNVWLNLLVRIYYILRRVGFRRLSRRVFFMIYSINLLNFGFKLRKFHFFYHLFRTRFFIFKGLSQSLALSLKNIIPGTNKVYTKFQALKEKSMTSSLITNLISVKLGQYYTINAILYPVAKWLKSHENVLGFRLLVSGRLTRRERASHFLQSYKAMPLSSYKRKIDYHQDMKIMKFGMVGIKVYLYVSKKTYNKYYVFKFNHSYI